MNQSRSVKNVVLTGEDLTPEEVHRIAADPGVKVAVAPKAMIAVRRSKRFLDSEVGKKVVYGVTTGFGPMASHIIGKSQLTELQYNLVRSHASGSGDPIPEPFVVAAMVVRLNTLVKGYSGVSERLVEKLALFINKRIVPIIPRHGGVGASGDLVQLAHIALCLIGEGEALYEGKRRQVREILHELKISPHVLEPKEGLSLINGTSVMAGIAAMQVVEASRLLSVAVRNGALSFELVNGLSDAISKELSQVRPHRGQVEVSRALREILASSKLLRDRKELQSRVAVNDDVYVTPEHIQDVYSFRCIPQILGPALDILEKVAGEVNIELNSVTDNPIIDATKKMFLHGGNFHGDYIATAVDQLKISIVKLTMLSERRTNFFLNRNVNQFLPHFINLKQPGLTLALQGLQFVSTSTAAHSQSLAYPHSVHSIPTNGDNQDVVSMGTDAALILAEVIENAYAVLAIEMITIAQAADCIGSVKDLSAPSRALFMQVRKETPKVVEDRSLSEDVRKVIRYLKSETSLGVAFRKD